jgi:hypothetical protein
MVQVHVPSGVEVRVLFWAPSAPNKLLSISVIIFLLKICLKH